MAKNKWHIEIVDVGLHTENSDNDQGEVGGAEEEEESGANGHSRG